MPQQQLITVDVHQHVEFDEREAEIPLPPPSISTLAVIHSRVGSRSVSSPSTMFSLNGFK